jgi:hypothetical protein
MPCPVFERREAVKPLKVSAFLGIADLQSDEPLVKVGEFYLISEY